MRTKSLWLGLAAVIILSFSVLIYYGREIYFKAPPIPKEITTSSGQVLFKEDDIQEGKQIWQSIGGQELGSVWGHGAYVAPDWTADWLHREAEFMLNTWSQRDFQKPFNELDDEKKAMLQKRLTNELKNNNVTSDGNLIVSPDRAEAI